MTNHSHYTADCASVESLQICKTIVHCPVHRAWNMYIH